MAVEKTPGGTYGGRAMPSFMARLMVPLMIRMHRRGGDRFQGMDLLYLGTTGAKSGQSRTTPVARVTDGDSWLVCASAAGATHHPAWYHNIVAHPDQVYAEVAGVRHHVTVEQLTGADRERGWALLVQQLPRFAGYTAKTDRELPLLRLTPITE
jgi:deazaflavin-dependent oxidoreductase (nitroreductase family)